MKNQNRVGVAPGQKHCPYGGRGGSCQRPPSSFKRKYPGGARSRNGQRAALSQDVVMLDIDVEHVVIARITWSYHCEIGP